MFRQAKVVFKNCHMCGDGEIDTFCIQCILDHVTLYHIDLQEDTTILQTQTESQYYFPFTAFQNTLIVGYLPSADVLGHEIPVSLPPSLLAYRDVNCSLLLQNHTVSEDIISLFLQYVFPSLLPTLSKSVMTTVMSKNKLTRCFWIYFIEHLVSKLDNHTEDHFRLDFSQKDDAVKIIQLIHRQIVAIVKSRSSTTVNTQQLKRFKNGNLSITTLPKRPRNSAVNSKTRAAHGMNESRSNSYLNRNDTEVTYMPISIPGFSTYVPMLLPTIVRKSAVKQD